MSFHENRRLYGIRNCDTMKKARAWLESHDVAYEFHDYKVAGITRQKLEQWSKVVGWEVLLNRAGTTFRKLPEPVKAKIDRHKALELMLEQPSMIKRPVLERGATAAGGLQPGEVFGAEVSVTTCSTTSTKSATKRRRRLPGGASLMGIDFYSCWTVSADPVPPRPECRKNPRNRSAPSPPRTCPADRTCPRRSH